MTLFHSVSRKHHPRHSQVIPRFNKLIKTFLVSFADRPKAPYLLIDSRRLDAGNIFIPVKENSELSLACVSEGGNPKPVLTWEILLSPGVDRHAQKISHELTHLEDAKKEAVRIRLEILFLEKQWQWWWLFTYKQNANDMLRSCHSA